MNYTFTLAKIGQINIRGYTQSSHVKWALWQWIQALAAFFFLGASLSFRAFRIGPVPVEEDESRSVVVSLSGRRRLGDEDREVEGAEDRVGFVGEGPGMEKE